METLSTSYAARVKYRRPSRPRRFVNTVVGWLAALGLTPANTVSLEVTGRKTGRSHAFAVTLATLGGERYLVSLAGESDRVRNLRAADGRAVIRHGQRQVIRAEEVPVDQRAAILEAFLSKRTMSKSPSAAARDYFGVDAHPRIESLKDLAGHYPVFKVIAVNDDEPR